MPQTGHRPRSPGSPGGRAHKPRLAQRDRVAAATAAAIQDSPAFAAYVDEIHATGADGLSQAEEARLGARIVAARRAREIASPLLLHGGARGALALVVILQGGKDAAQTLAAANLALVIPVAAIYVGQGITLPDLVAEGNIALVQAAQTFDHARGRYSTHATWKIWHALRDCMARKSRVIRLPHYIHDAIQMLGRARAHATGMGEEWPLERLADFAGVPLAHAIAATQAPAAVSISTLRLGSGGGNGSDNPGHDRPPEEQIDEDGDTEHDGWQPSPAEAVATSRALLAQLQDTIPRARLTADETVALRHTFGLEGADALSMPRIAALLGLRGGNGRPDGGAARRIVNTALSKLRLAMGEPGRAAYRPRADKKPSARPKAATKPGPKRMPTERAS